MRKSNLFLNYQYFLISLFVFMSVILPAFVLNKILFILIFLFFFIDIKNVKIKPLFQPIIIFLIFFIGYNISIYTFSSHELALQFLLSIFILFCIYPIIVYKIDMDIIVKRVGVALSLITLIFLYFLVINPTNFLSNIFLNIFNNYSLGANSLRIIIGNESSFMFHLGAVPFLFLSLSLYSKDFFQNGKIKELLYIILFLFIIILSTSRALFITSILIVFIASLLYLNKKNRMIVLILFCILLTYFVTSYFKEISYMFDSSEISNSTKKAHIESFFNNLTAVNFIFGEGLASYYFSSGKGGITAHTEITIIDMMRYFGIIGTLSLYVIILNPNLRLTLKLNKNKIYYIIVFMFYTIMSFSNPTMFNSYGLIIILWYWYKMIIRR